MSSQHHNDDDSLQSLVEELTRLRLTQAAELSFLIQKHRRQETQLLDRMAAHTTSETYYDTMDSSTDHSSSSSVIEVMAPVPVTPEIVIPVATRVAPKPRAYDENNDPLEIGDNVVVLQAGRNNEAGDSAKVIAIHPTKHNWLKISILGTPVTTHRLGTNLQKIHHFP